MTEQTKSLPKRSEIAVEDKWNLEAIFETDEAWEKEFAEVKGLLPGIAKYQGKLGKSAATLYEVLQLQDEISRRLGQLYTYAHMRSDEDTANAFYQDMNDRVASFAARVSSALSFIVPEILAMEESKLDEFLNEDERLRLYAFALEQINKKRKHILPAEQEAILAQASEVTDNPSNTFGMLNNADLEFPSIKDENGEEVDVTHGRYIRFLESDDRRVRKDAFQAMYDTYGHYKNTFASTLSGAVKSHNFYASVRNYESARQAALDANHIPEKVYDNLISTVHKHLHLLHRYARLRKNVLQLDELHMYDLYTPLVKDVEMKYSFDEAKEMVLRGLKPMGEDYLQVIREGYKNRWIDVYENKGKRSGAYSSGSYSTMPYILLNWQNNVNSMFTLAHELGHSAHSYYTRRHQPYPYGNYSIFVAEVASTCNESLLNHYLLETLEDKKKRLYLLNHMLEGFRGTLYRQTMFAEFEQMIHEKAAAGESLTADKMTRLYYELNVKYFGEDVHVDDDIGLEWARIPHFYLNYYVYQYATGFSAAASLSKQILQEGEPAVNRYLEFLKAGSSDYPIEVLKKAGVDMTTPQPIEDALSVFADVLEEMEQLLEQ
ncbi:MAG TPA: oligoendopeptidase F [Bacillales bacterium]|nr:oligoendopeptidase F [Bacillales bacterium]